MPLRADVYAEFFYRDLAAAVAFLDRAFGFSTERLVKDEAGAPIHAELRLGDDVVMAGRLGPADRRYCVPAEVDGANTGHVYVGVDDIDAIYARALAGGATLVRELAPNDYGFRDFGVRDPEGYLWYVGTYRVRAGDSVPTLIPGARYHDAPAAIRWLTTVAGFAEDLVVAGDAGRVDHAQLTYRNGAYMLGSARDDDRDFRTPSDIGGRYTHGFGLFTADPDVHHATALAAGAEVIDGPADGPDGVRSYHLRDPEGYVWTVGNYRPA